MLRCGLLGRKLGHSYSPQIHRELSCYEYKLYEKEPEELEAFLKSCTFDGLNVTIPYKKTVMAYLDEISPEAAAIGSVNTIVNRGGKLTGYNTDAFGFSWLLQKSGVEAADKKALVFGSGGASGDRVPRSEKPRRRPCRRHFAHRRKQLRESGPASGREAADQRDASWHVPE